MAKRTKQTPNQREFQRQVKRIRNAIRRLEKQGLEVDYQGPPLEMPTRVTKSRLQQLKSVNRAKLLSYSTSVDTETGEIISGRQWDSERRSRAAKKAAATRARNRIAQSSTDLVSPESIGFPKPEEPPAGYDEKWERDDEIPMYSELVISSFRYYLDSFGPRVQNYLNIWLNSLIRTYGEESVAIMLNDSPDTYRLTEFFSRYKYGSDTAIEEYCQALLNFLPEITQNELDNIMDEFNESEGYGIWNE